MVVCQMVGAVRIANSDRHTAFGPRSRKVYSSDTGVVVVKVDFVARKPAKKSFEEAVQKGAVADSGDSLFFV